MNSRLVVLLATASVFGTSQSKTSVVPHVDYHRHLQSPAASRLGADPPLATLPVPSEWTGLLEARAKVWNQPAALAELLTADSTLLDPAPRWIRGRAEVATKLAGYFRAPYRIVAVTWSRHEGAGHLTGYYVRGDGASTRYLGHVQLAMERDASGQWRIASEAPIFAGPVTPQPVTAADLVSQMDAAKIRQAVVLSLAYWFASAGRNLPDEEARVRQENDWTATEASRFRERLVAFCSVNPLKDYAVAEVDRCAQNPDLHGLKLHFANSGVDLKNASQLERVKQVFRAANRHRWPVVVHLWVPDPAYGREHSERFLDAVLPEAPDVVVQIAHLAGGGSVYSDAALAVFAGAIARDDPRTRRVYFDVTAVADAAWTDASLQQVVGRLRAIGLSRILFGSDMAPPPAWQPWMKFRMTLPLSDAEFQQIAENVAPYLRGSASSRD